MQRVQCRKWEAKFGWFDPAWGLLDVVNPIMALLWRVYIILYNTFLAVKWCGKSCNKFKWFTVWGLRPSIPIFKVNMVKHQPCDDQNVNPNSKWFDQVPFYHVSGINHPSNIMQHWVWTRPTNNHMPTGSDWVSNFYHFLSILRDPSAPWSRL